MTNHITAGTRLVRQAIEITEREIRDPIGHWGIGRAGLANRFGMDTTERTAHELEVAAMARLGVLQRILAARR